MRALDEEGRSPVCRHCGAAGRPGSSVCPRCGLDPVLSEEALRASPAPSLAGGSLDRLIATPQEDRALAVSLLLTFGGAVVISILTLGTFLLLLGVSVLRVIAHRATVGGDLVPVGPKNNPVVYNLARVAAFRLQMKPVDVFIRHSYEPNAFASGLGSRCFIVVNSILVRTLNPEELLYIIGHEMGHIRRAHVFWQVLMGNPIVPPLPLAGTFFRYAFLGWSRASEASADRAGLLAVRDLGSSQSALIKLISGPDARKSVSPEEFIEASKKNGEILTELGQVLRTHPLTVRRLEALQSFWEQVRPIPRRRTEGMQA